MPKKKQKKSVLFDEKGTVGDAVVLESKGGESSIVEGSEDGGANEVEKEGDEGGGKGFVDGATLVGVELKETSSEEDGVVEERGEREVREGGAGSAAHGACNKLSQVSRVNGTCSLVQLGSILNAFKKVTTSGEERHEDASDGPEIAFFPFDLYWRLFAHFLLCDDGELWAEVGNRVSVVREVKSGDEGVVGAASAGFGETGQICPKLG